MLVEKTEEKSGKMWVWLWVGSGAGNGEVLHTLTSALVLAPLPWDSSFTCCLVA